MEVRIAVDTNRYSAFFKGSVEAATVFESAEELIIPLIVLAELRSGFAGGTRTDENERVLRAFLSKPGVHVLSPDESTTHHYGNLHASLKRTGKSIPDNDLWIAALCVQHALPLYTLDRHFVSVPKLALL